MMTPTSFALMMVFSLAFLLLAGGLLVGAVYVVADLIGAGRGRR